MARGIVTAIDSLDFFVQAQDTNLGFAIAAASNQTNIGGTITNTQHRGAVMYVQVTSLTVNTATLALGILGINPVTGNGHLVGKVSLDGIVTNGQYAISFYPGMVSANTSGGSFAQGPCLLPAKFQIQASMTVSTTASMTGSLTYSVNMSRVL